MTANVIVTITAVAIGSVVVIIGTSIENFYIKIGNHNKTERRVIMNAEVGKMVVLTAAISCGSQCDCADPGTGADDCKCEDH